MALEPYKEKQWLYQHYIVKRMKLKDIAKLLKDTYNITITEQALYNWCKKYDLPRLKGKGRRLGANLQHKGPAKKAVKSPARQRQEQMRKQMAARKKNRGRRT